MKLAWDMFTLLSCAQYCTNQGVDNTILSCQIVYYNFKNKELK